MQEMTRKFNDEKTVENLYSFMGDPGKEYLPHSVTENEFLERLDPENLEKIKKRLLIPCSIEKHLRMPEC